MGFTLHWFSLHGYVLLENARNKTFGFGEMRTVLLLRHSGNQIAVVFVRFELNVHHWIDNFRAYAIRCKRVFVTCYGYLHFLAIGILVMLSFLENQGNIPYRGDSTFVWFLMSKFAASVLLFGYMLRLLHFVLLVTLTADDGKRT